jgi:3D (Asp-Asp-Asp) domain-containing protein
MLIDGLTINISRALPLTIQVDGQTMQVKSRFNTPLEVLAEAGVELGAADYTSPAPETNLQAGDTIEIIRVTDEFRFEDEEIPFQTVYQPSADLDLDSKAVLSSGASGTTRRRYRLLIENGVQIGEELEEEWVDVQPVNQVIGYGTKINTGMVDTPEGPREYWRVVRMRVTAYTAASSGKAPDHPTYGITASGVMAGTGVVAVDPNVVPFRSEVYVPDYGIGFVGDTGGGVKGRWIDLGYDKDELVAWNGYTDVYYLTPVPENINYLLPEVLP